MVTKALIGLVGVAAVAATASLPASDKGSALPAVAPRVAAEAPAGAPAALKGDSLAILVSDCASDCAASAAATVPAGRWLTVERRVGASTSVLIKIPVADLAAAEIVSRVFAAPQATEPGTMEQSALR